MACPTPTVDVRKNELVLERMVFNSFMEVDMMTHDLDDLLDLIKKLELRIIELEKTRRLVMDESVYQDRWYFDY